MLSSLIELVQVQQVVLIATLSNVYIHIHIYDMRQTKQQTKYIYYK